MLPVRVQGAEAPVEIAAAIRYANQHRLADLLVVGRGGGSIEDLWAFNDELVAHAIYGSKIPVISAVGHEPDVTISDYVADLRAATPSNAAELAVPDQDALRQLLDTMSASMATSVLRQVKASRQHLNALSSSPTLKSPEQYLKLRADALAHLRTHLISKQQQVINIKKQRFVAITAKLDAMSPLKVLTRGYAMIQASDGDVVRSVKQVRAGEEITVSVADGKMTATLNEIKEESL